MLKRHPIFTPTSGVTAGQGGSLGLSSANWPAAPTLASTAASFTAPLRAAVGSVFASSGTLTLTNKPKSSSSKQEKQNKAGDDGARGSGDRESDSGERRPPVDGGAGGGGDGGNAASYTHLTLPTNREV